MKILISYRADTASYALRIGDALIAHFGKRQVSLLSDDLRPAIIVEQTIENGSVLLMVIGPGWLGGRNSSGTRRIHDPNDPVYLSAAKALRRGIGVVPVLVGDARMPAPQQLPAAIVRLASLHALEMRDVHWDFGARRLIETILRIAGEDAASIEAMPNATAPAPGGARRNSYIQGTTKNSRMILAPLGKLVKQVTSGFGGLFKFPHAQTSARSTGVDFAIFGPGILAPDSHSIVDVWAYPAGDFSQVEALAREVNRSQALGRAVGHEMELGALITLELTIAGLPVAQATGSIVWRDVPANASFVVHVPADARPGTFAGQAVLRADGIKFCDLPFVITVGEQASPDPSCYGRVRRRVRTAFASYASADREEAFARLQGIRKAAPDMKIFVDVMSLRSGDDWERRLKAEVPTKDVFYLFWSQAAARSSWVKREWSMALEQRGLAYIDPVPLQDPCDLEIPEDLKSLHFNDAFLMHIEYQRLRKTAQETG